MGFLISMTFCKAATSSTCSVEQPIPIFINEPVGVLITFNAAANGEEWNVQWLDPSGTAVRSDPFVTTNGAGDYSIHRVHDRMPLGLNTVKIFQNGTVEGMATFTVNEPDSTTPPPIATEWEITRISPVGQDVNFGRSIGVFVRNTSISTQTAYMRASAVVPGETFGIDILGGLGEIDRIITLTAGIEGGVTFILPDTINILTTVLVVSLYQEPKQSSLITEKTFNFAGQVVEPEPSPLPPNTERVDCSDPRAIGSLPDGTCFANIITPTPTITFHEINIRFLNPLGLGERIAIKAAEQQVAIQALLPAAFTYTNYSVQNDSITLFITEEGSNLLPILLVIAIVALVIILAGGLFFFVGYTYKENTILKATLTAKEETKKIITDCLNDVNLTDEQKIICAKEAIANDPDIVIPPPGDGIFDQLKPILWAMVGIAALSAISGLTRRK